MTTSIDHTTDAQEMIGDFVVDAGKSFLTIRAINVFGKQEAVKITLTDLAEFYSNQSTSLSSSVLTLAGLHGDCRHISELADIALGWFKAVNVEGMRREASKVGLIPKF